MFKRLLLPIYIQDPSILTEKALAFAVEQTIKNDAELHIVTVVPGFGMQMVASYFPEDAMDKAKDMVDKSLRSYVADKIPPNVTPKIKTLEGKHYREILKEANRINADLIIMPSHQHNRLDKERIGSCASKVSERAKASVMLIRPSSA